MYVYWYSAETAMMDNKTYPSELSFFFNSWRTYNVVYVTSRDKLVRIWSRHSIYGLRGESRPRRNRSIYSFSAYIQRQGYHATYISSSLRRDIYDIVCEPWMLKELKSWRICFFFFLLSINIYYIWLKHTVPVVYDDKSHTCLINTINYSYDVYGVSVNSGEVDEQD